MQDEDSLSFSDFYLISFFKYLDHTFDIIKIGPI